MYLIIYVVFYFHYWHSVRGFICGLGSLDFNHLVEACRVMYHLRIKNFEHALLQKLFRWYFSVSVVSDEELFAVGTVHRKIKI
jgi:ABC-type amino acid transport system permease subunit